MDWIMDNWELILAVLGVLIAIVFVVIITIKLLKQKKLLPFVMVLLDFMAEAEKQGLSGEKKREYVITKGKEWGTANALNLSTQQIDFFIEKFIDFSNVVNVNKIFKK